MFREAGLSVYPSQNRGRVMKARFDGWIIRLSNRARAIAGVMFRREAWDVRSGLVIGACCRLMPYGQGTSPGGAFGLRWSLPGARPAQGHYSGNP